MIWTNQSSYFGLIGGKKPASKLVEKLLTDWIHALPCTDWYTWDSWFHPVHCYNPVHHHKQTDCKYIHQAHIGTVQKDKCSRFHLLPYLLERHLRKLFSNQGWTCLWWLVCCKLELNIRHSFANQCNRLDSLPDHLGSWSLDFRDKGTLKKAHSIINLVICDTPYCSKAIEGDRISNFHISPTDGATIFGVSEIKRRWKDLNPDLLSGSSEC